MSEPISSPGSVKSSAIPLFSTGLRVLWVVCLLITLVAELIPMPLISPLPFYSLKAFKGLSFLCFGFATPLAFWRFDSLGYGILVALVMTVIVEASQAPIMGHSFSWLEMAAKVVFVFFGFMFGLNARYDRQISLGPWRVSLLPGHSVAHQKTSKAGR